MSHLLAPTEHSPADEKRGLATLSQAPPTLTKYSPGECAWTEQPVSRFSRRSTVPLSHLSALTQPSPAPEKPGLATLSQAPPTLTKYSPGECAWTEQPVSRFSRRSTVPLSHLSALTQPSPADEKWGLATLSQAPLTLTKYSPGECAWTEQPVPGFSRFSNVPLPRFPKRSTLLSLSLPALLISVLSLTAQAQTPQPRRADGPTPTGHLEPPALAESASANYLLGPDDQITVFAPDVEEISGKPVRVDMRGDINLPLAGRLQAAGLTANQLESAIETRLKKYLKTPEVVVSITEFRSQPISVLGAVATPGVHQLQSRKTLFEVLSMAGGLRADAGNTITVTRRLQWGPIPLPNAKNDQTGQFSVASVKAKSIIDGSNPAENISVKPEDVISVSKADLVYVVGSVHKPGGFVLGENDSISTLQVLSLAEGLDKTAAPDKAKIMRPVAGTTNRTEIPIDLKKLMAGKNPDLHLQADDILFVPTSAAKNAAARAAEAAIQIGTGMAIYGRL